MRKKTRALHPPIMLLVIAAIFALLSPLIAQESDSSIDIDMDSLFGDDVVEVADESPSAFIDPVSSILKREGVRLGGAFNGSTSLQATWTNLWDGSSSLVDPDNETLTSSLGSTIFFDARPREDFRVYGSAKTSWPSSTSDASSIDIPNINIFELFSDVSINDRVFIRFGKSTVKWGVGYFWSPADVINLEPINLFDTEAQREGPVNIRIHIPFLGTQNNMYIYSIFDQNDVDFDTTAIALRAEILFGTYELGIGGYYRADTAERAMLTLTGPLGSFDIFGEAMISRGSAKTFISSIQTTSPWAVLQKPDNEIRNQVFVSASAGFLYSNSNENVTALGQYYYNGESYSDSQRDQLVTDAKLALGLAALFGTDDDRVRLARALSSLVLGSGRHYAGLSVSKGEAFHKNLSFSTLIIANLSDLSGIVKPSATWKATDNLSLALSPTFIFGPDDGEYSFLAGGNIVSLSFGATLKGQF
jgi:hypothetical protein